MFRSDLNKYSFLKIIKISLRRQLNGEDKLRMQSVMKIFKTAEILINLYPKNAGH
jgi:hypothetical protein